MDDRSIEMERFTSAIDLIRSKFPELHIESEEEEEGLHAAAHIAEQPGLDFFVSINLQNCDELHLWADVLWASWFPVGEDSVFEKFMDAVLGILSGEYRIVENRLLGTHINAQLQKPSGHEWETVFTSRPVPSLAFLPLPRKKRYVQNRAAT